MRLLPSHLHDAKEMARTLCDRLAQMGLRTNCRDPQAVAPSLQQTQELLAKAMGYASWRELSTLLAEAHEPVYLDQVDKNEYWPLLDGLATRLSAALGYDYAHGYVSNAIGNSGLGFSPKARRAMRDNSSPWGPIGSVKEIAPGVRSISTTTHGGWLLSEDRQQNMPAHLRLPGGAYEEDGEFYLVAMGFPEEARSMGINMLDALTYLQIITQSKETTKLSEMGEKVVSYLTQCVHLNRIPLRFPEEIASPAIYDPSLSCKLDSATLQEWMDLLGTIPTIDGHWAMRAGPWFEHWGWQVRDAQRQDAYERILNRALDEARANRQVTGEQNV